MLLVCFKSHAGEMDCLAEIVYREANTQTLTEQNHIIQTVKNRVKDPRWPDNICQVMKQPGQFPWYNHRTHQYRYTLDNLKTVITHNHTPTSATYFHSYPNKTYWKHLTYINQVGKHHFYK